MYAMTGTSQNSEDKLCAVKYCCNQHTFKEDVSYFSLPVDVVRRALWFDNCFPDVADKQSISLRSRICQDHFENKMFIDIREKNRLTDFASPILFNNEILVRRRYDVTLNKMPVDNGFSTDLSSMKLSSDLYKARCRIKELQDTKLRLSNLIAENDTVENFLNMSAKLLPPNFFLIIESHVIHNLTKSDNKSLKLESLH